MSTALSKYLLNALPLTVLALGTFSPGTDAIVAKEHVTLESVIKVWRKREETVKSFRFELSNEDLTGKGSLMGGPPAETTAKLNRILIVDGSKMRYERTGDQWTSKGVTAFKYIATFDGRIDKQLFLYPRADEFVHSRAWIRSTKQHSDARNFHLSPIIRHMRPLSSDFHCIDVDRLKILREDDSFRRIHCVVLEEPHPENNRRYEYWVAPEQEMAIVRQLQYFREVLENEAEVTFKQDPKHGWIPDHWHTARYGDEEKSLLDSSTAQVTEYKLNASVPESTFDVDFPARTEVFDRRTASKPASGDTK